MAKRETIRLAEPIPWHRGLIEEIVVRGPTLPEYSRYGDPFEFVQPAKGKPVYVENDEAIAGYMECCVEEPKDKLALDHVGLADAMRIKQAILGFFDEARRAVYAPTSQTS